MILSIDENYKAIYLHFSKFLLKEKHRDELDVVGAAFHIEWSKQKGIDLASSYQVHNDACL